MSTLHFKMLRNHYHLRTLDSSVSKSMRKRIPTEIRVWKTALMYLESCITNSDGLALNMKRKISTNIFSANTERGRRRRVFPNLGWKKTVKQLLVAEAWAAAARSPICMLSLDNTDDGTTVCGRVARRIPKNSWFFSFLTMRNTVKRYNTSHKKC